MSGLEPQSTSLMHSCTVPSPVRRLGGEAVGAEGTPGAAGTHLSASLPRPPVCTAGRGWHLMGAGVIGQAHFLQMFADSTLALSQGSQGGPPRGRRAWAHLTASLEAGENLQGSGGQTVGAGEVEAGVEAKWSLGHDCCEGSGKRRVLWAGSVAGAVAWRWVHWG